MVLLMRTFVWVAFLLGGLGSARALPPAANVVELREQLQTSLSDSAAPGALWGVQVNSQRSGDVWFATNAAVHLIPASNTKLFTAALSLDRLGADHRFLTSLRVLDDPQADGSLTGDLRVVGGGDPTRCGRLYGGNWEKAFVPLVEAVRNAGIRRIVGDLVCDESAFRGAHHGSGWDSEDLASYYGAAVSALTAEDNCVNVVVTPAQREGDPAVIQFSPFPAGLTLIPKVTTGPARAAANIELFRLPGRAELTVSGTIPVGRRPVVQETSVPDPARWFGELFQEALRRAGIPVTGDVKVVTAADRSRAPDSRPWRELAAIPSPPVGDVVREMMKPSQNLYAQLLLLGVGAVAERYPREGMEARARSAPTTEAAGLIALEQFLGHHGIAAAEVVLEEGSGLSRKNRVTPRAIIQLLERMPAHRWGTAWMDSLPIGGRDGTLRNRFTHAPTLGNVRAKTGTLRQVTSLAGYLTNSVGEPLIFSILVNNYVPQRPGATARAEVDHLVELLAQSRVR